MFTVRIQRKRRRKTRRVISPSVLAVIVFAVVAIITAQAMTYIWLATMIAGLPLAYYLGYRRSKDEIARLRHIAQVNREILNVDAGEVPGPDLTGKIPANTFPKARVTRDRLLNDPRSGARPIPGAGE